MGSLFVLIEASRPHYTMHHTLSICITWHMGEIPIRVTGFFQHWETLLLNMYQLHHLANHNAHALSHDKGWLKYYCFLELRRCSVMYDLCSHYNDDNKLELFFILTLLTQISLHWLYLWTFNCIEDLRFSVYIVRVYVQVCVYFYTELCSYRARTLLGTAYRKCYYKHNYIN